MRLLHRAPSATQWLAAREACAVQAIRSYPSSCEGSHRAVVMSPKGGVGKTVASAALAHYLSELRGEIVSVLDANTHTGTLRRRLVPPVLAPPAPMIELARLALAGHAAPEWPWLARWHDLVGRMRVFGNQGADPMLVEAMSGAGYAALIGLLSRASQIIVQDMGTSVTGDLARGALDSADTLVIVSDLTQDTLELTMETITTLAGAPPSYTPHPADHRAVDDGRYAALVAGAVVVVNPSRDQNLNAAEVDALLDWLRAACAAVVLVPRDTHLATGGLIDWTAVRPETRVAHLEVAAHVAARLPYRPGLLRPEGADTTAAVPQRSSAPREPQRPWRSEHGQTQADPGRGTAAHHAAAGALSAPRAT